MEDLIITVAATIQAAEIQAASTIQAAEIQADSAICAAFMGGVALIISICFTAYFTLKAHKADKLAELNSKTYFDCVAIYAEFAAAAFDIIYNDQSRSEIFLSNQQNFLFALNKASFVSNRNTQLEIGRFINFFNEWFLEFNIYLNLSRSSDSEIYSMFVNNKLTLDNYDSDKIRSNSIISARNKVLILDEEFRGLEDVFRADLGIKESTVTNKALRKETQELSEKTLEILKKILS